MASEWVNNAKEKKNACLISNVRRRLFLFSFSVGSNGGHQSAEVAGEAPAGRHGVLAADVGGGREGILDRANSKEAAAAGPPCAAA